MTNKFNTIYQQILEMNTSGDAFGSPAVQNPLDVYAPGDSRIPFIMGMDKNKRLKVLMQRRKLKNERKQK